MAENYGQGVNYQTTDYSVLPVDYSFLNLALKTRETQYESAAGQVKSMYNSILSAPISNLQNLEVRQKYMNEAKSGIQALTKTDLSDTKNIAEASKIFAPFWQDDDILADINLTKQLTAQEQRGYSDNDSKDVKVRATYNPESIKRIAWAKKDLREARRGDGSINKVEAPSYVPRLDENDAMSEYNKASGFKGNKYIRHSGAYMATTTNGVQAIPDYKTRASGVLGAAFNPQFEQQGYNKMRSDMEAVKRAHPDYDQPRIIKEIANMRYAEYRGGLGESVQNHADFIKTLQNSIQDLEDNGKSLTDEQKKDKRNLEAQLEEHSNYHKNLVNDLEKFDQTYKTPEDLYPELIRNPEEYYGRIIRTATINNMANTLASNRSYEEDINPVWKFGEEQKLKGAEYNLNVAKFHYDQKNDALNRDVEYAKIAADLQKGKLKRDANGNIVNVTTGAPVSEGIHDAGRASTTLQNRGGVSNVIEEQKNNYIGSAVNSFRKSTGILSRLGASESEISDINTFITRRYEPENRNAAINFSSNKEAASYEKVKTALERSTGKKIYSTGQFINAIIEYTGNELTNAKEISKPSQTDVNDKNNLIEAYSNLIDVHDAQEKYDLINRQQKELIQKEVTSKEGKSTYKPLLSDDGMRLADLSDKTKYAPELELVDDYGNRRILTKKEFAQLHDQRAISNMNGDKITISDKPFYITKVNGKSMSLSSYFNKPIADYEKRFGSYQEQDKLNKKLYDKADDRFGILKSVTGREGRTFYWDMAKKGEEAGTNEKLGIEAMNPDNQLSMPEVDGKPIKIGSEEDKYLQSAVKSTDAIIANQLQFKYNNVSGTSPRSVQVTLSTDKDVPDALKGKTVMIPIKPGASGDVLSAIPVNTGVYVWDKMLHGEDIQANKLDKSIGFNYEITPLDRNHPSVYKLNYYYDKYDPKSDVTKYPNHMIPTTQTYEIDMRTSSPDEVRNKISDLRKQTVNYLMQVRALQQKQATK